MAKRNNNGYIGGVFDLDIKGVIDLHKRNNTRYKYDTLTYQDPALQFTGIDQPTGSLFALGVSNFGSGSAATTSLVSGTLANVTIYTAGTGYATNATLSFSGGGGTGANAYVSTFAAGALSVVERLGYVKDIVITDPGQGYTSAPTMTVSAPVTANGVAGVTAIISASITNGQLTGYTIHNTGSNYRAGLNWPTITFSGGGATRAATAVPVLEFGRNYTSNPTVTVTGPGSGAVVSASIVGVLSPTGTVTTAGGGYSSAPTINIPATDALVSASATLNAGALNTITIATGSSTVHNAPNINIGGELSYPALNNNEIYGTYAVYNNNSNWVAFNVTTNGGGGYTVDWGDGTSNNYNTNVTASKQYTTSSYAALSSSLYDGTKLTRIKITLSGSATSLATVNLTTRPTPTTGSFPSATAQTNHWLSIAAAGTNITSFTLGASATGNNCTSGMLQRFYFSGSNQISNFQAMFLNCYSLREVTELYMGSGSSYGGVIQDLGMFENCTNLIKIPTINLNSATTTLGYMFSQCRNLPTITFLNSENIFDYTATFSNCLVLESINGSILNSPNVTSLSSTFNNCLNLVELPAINVTNVTNMASTFQACYSLTSLKFTGNTSKVTTFSSTFLSCLSLSDIPKVIDATSATTLSSMFNGCRQLQEAPTITNSTQVTNVSSMFSGCSSLRRVPLFDTRSVTTFVSMFSGCTSLISIPRFNLRSATTVSGMFQNATNLKTIPLLNTANVTTFTSMFTGCLSLITIPAINTAKGTAFDSMFSGCNGLKFIPYLNTGNGTTLAAMFASCTLLSEISTLDTSNATTLLNMFNDCRSLKRVPNFNIPNCTSLQQMFINCYALTQAPTFYNANKVTTIASMYNACTSLVQIPSMSGAALTSIASAFANCGNLIEIGSIACSAAGLVTTTTPFTSCSSLKRMGITNINASFTVANCSLDSNALNEIYTNLSATGAGKTITVTGNWGTANDTPSIATTKGWTVSG